MSFVYVARSAAVGGATSAGAGPGSLPTGSGLPSGVGAGFGAVAVWSAVVPAAVPLPGSAFFFLCSQPEISARLANVQLHRASVIARKMAQTTIGGKTRKLDRVDRRALVPEPD